MGKLHYLLIITVTLFIYSCTSDTATNPEEVDESPHFDFLLYDGLNESITSEMSTALASNFERITTDLGVENMPLVTIRLWGDYEHFLTDMVTIIGTRYEGATGYVSNRNEICMYHTGQNPMTVVHEFAHLVSMQVNNTIPNNPRWLWEAIAIYESDDFINPSTLPYMVAGNYPTLNELNTDYNSSNNSIYSVGYVLYEYIIETWGRELAIELIVNNGRIVATLGISYEEFESGWYQFIEEKYLN